MATWRLLDHPADLAVEGRGATPAEAVEGVAAGLLAQVQGPLRGQGHAVRHLEVVGLDLQECLVSTFNELLYLVNSEGWSVSGCRVLHLAETSLAMEVHGGPRSPTGTLELEVKAATYHELALAEQPDGGWCLRVVFDV